MSELYSCRKKPKRWVGLTIIVAFSLGFYDFAVPILNDFVVPINDFVVPIDDFVVPIIKLIYPILGIKSIKFF